MAKQVKIDWAVMADGYGDRLDSMTRDEVILELVGSGQGISLNAATKGYVAMRKARGMHVGVVSYKDQATKILDELAPTGLVDPAELIAAIQAEHPVKTDTAMDYIRAHAGNHGYQVKTRLASEVMLEWIVDNAPAADASQESWTEFDTRFQEWALAEGRTQSNINEYRKGLRLHVRLLNR